jgi:hypothetical protein
VFIEFSTLLFIDKSIKTRPGRLAVLGLGRPAFSSFSRLPLDEETFFGRIGETGAFLGPTGFFVLTSEGTRTNFLDDEAVEFS